MNNTYHFDFPPMYTNTQPIENSLEFLGFKKSDNGLYARRWGPLSFMIGDSMWGIALIREGYVTRREMYPPQEIQIPKEIALIELMALIYRLWSEVFANQDPPDMPLLWGKQWLDYRREVKEMIPPPPTLWVDREFLRFVLSYLERMDDWVKEDYDIRLSHVPGQLRLSANGREVFCPAEGHWLDASVVSARSLFRGLPKRFTGSIVSLTQSDKEVVIGRHVIPARWDEESAA